MNLLSKLIVGLLITQIIITIFGIWYITTNPKRELDRDCTAYIKESFPFGKYDETVAPDVRVAFYKGCMEQGGSKRWELLDEIRHDTNNINSKL